MNRRRCLQLAQRIDAQLQLALGEGIVPERMLESPRYARDVLLVCEAMPGTEMQSLASLYRAALEQDDAAPASSASRTPLGIGSLLNSIFGPITEAQDTAAGPATETPHAAQAAQPRRRWFGLVGAKGTAAEHVARRLQDQADAS